MLAIRESVLPRGGAEGTIPGYQNVAFSLAFSAVLTSAWPWFDGKQFGFVPGICVAAGATRGGDNNRTG